MFCCALCWFLGLREEPIEKEKKTPPKKEVKVEKSLFRLYERPAMLLKKKSQFLKKKKFVWSVKEK